MGSLVQIQSPRPFLSPMPALLLTNDDGVHAAGLAALEQALAELGDAYVLAPEREQSACGHALTLHRPLRVDRLGERRFGVNGTPSDCVNLGVLGFLPERPVLVVAGVNHGTNLGDDVTYSGTVSAAMEGTLLGVPSIAVSLAAGGDLAVAAEVARLIALRVLVTGLPPRRSSTSTYRGSSRAASGSRVSATASTPGRSWSRQTRGVARTTGSARASPSGRGSRAPIWGRCTRATSRSRRSTSTSPITGHSSSSGTSAGASTPS